MAVRFTPDQQRVIDVRNKNVLVSAAAGSGKTAVLVERILSLITDPKKPVDIDRLLVVTFTKAAAAQMKERLHGAILQRLEEKPDDGNLQRQAILLHHAQITTIDSFCQFILRNHFQEIGLDPGFRVGDPGRIRLMEKETLEAVMEEAYREGAYYDGFSADFLEMTDVFARKAQDRFVEETVLRLYHFVTSLPYPEKWLKESLKDYETEDFAALSRCGFMQDMMTDISDRLQGFLRIYDGMLAICRQGDGPSAYEELLQRERELLEEAAGQKEYAAVSAAAAQFTFERMKPVKSGSCSEEKKERVKKLREGVKKRFLGLKELYFDDEPEAMAADMKKTGRLVKPLVYLTLRFMECFAAEKAKENIIDFGDMEHFALRVLADEAGNPTETARQYRERYAQIMIDEYQDSNEVQELLLSVISGEEHPNRFMVGDVKQSIYKFRMARPEIFIEKYHAYKKEAEDGGGSIRIDLKQNFRSRREVIDTVNHTFAPLMGKTVGGIDYDADAALSAGAVYPEACQSPEDGFDTELLVFEKKDAGEETALSAADGEAYMIAMRIRELLRTGVLSDGTREGLRPVAYEDIVILVRSSGPLLESLEEALKKEGIPYSMPGVTGYFSEGEVQTMLQLLSVLVNPAKDIPLAAVLKSPLYGFTDEELAEIGLTGKEEGEKPGFYQRLKLAGGEAAGKKESVPADGSKAGGELREKIRAFLEELARYRRLSKTESVHDLLYLVIREHRYLEYVTALPSGGVRRANVMMLLEKALEYEKLQMHGIFGFLRYMSQLEKYEVDYGTGAKESARAVRVMTIHKSKGLEFPICFVAGLSRRFNRRDTSGSVLLHTDLGIGMEYRESSRRCKRKTIKQKIIAERMRNEEMGEELRVLYVALTRAKEKLILTGTSEDYEKAQRDCYSLNAGQYVYEAEKRRVEPDLILESGSYLKLWMHAYSLYGDRQEWIPRVRIFHEEELRLAGFEEAFAGRMKKEELATLLLAEKEDEELRRRISFTYPHENLRGLYTKTSVSELKMAALHVDEQTEVLFETEREDTVVPLFMQKEKMVGGAARGSAYHRLMELLDFKAFCRLAGDIREESEEAKDEAFLLLLRRQKEELLRQGRMCEAELSLIDEHKIGAFLRSPLFAEMAEADERGELYREQPFVMTIAAGRVNPSFPKEETMLIQGIIDAYYVKEDAICLLDYKTDRVDKKEDLIQRYQVQLDYYKEALEKLTGKKVAEVLIYSYHFLETLRL